LSRAHNSKSPGSNQIQNYWLKAFPAAHGHITKNFNTLMEEITYLLPNSRDSKEVRNYQPITFLTTMYKTQTGITARRSPHI
jgi:hypothetical protein